MDSEHNTPEEVRLKRLRFLLGEAAGDRAEQTEAEAEEAGDVGEVEAGAIPIPNFAPPASSTPSSSPQPQPARAPTAQPELAAAVIVVTGTDAQDLLKAIKLSLTGETRRLPLSDITPTMLGLTEDVRDGRVRPDGVAGGSSASTRVSTRVHLLEGVAGPLSTSRVRSDEGIAGGSSASTRAHPLEGVAGPSSSSRVLSEGIAGGSASAATRAHPLEGVAGPSRVRQRSKSSSDDDDAYDDSDYHPAERRRAPTYSNRRECLPSTSSGGFGDENAPPSASGSKRKRAASNWREMSFPSTSSGRRNESFQAAPQKRKPGRPKGSKNKASSCASTSKPSEEDPSFTVRCHVCSEVKEDDPHCLTDCGHVFHIACLQQWTESCMKKYRARARKLCPYCGSPYEKTFKFFN